MVSHSDFIKQSMNITDYKITPVLFTEENLIQKLNEMSVEDRASVTRLLNQLNELRHTTGEEKLCSKYYIYHTYVELS